MSSKPSGRLYSSASSQTSQQSQPQPPKTAATISIGKKPSTIVYAKKPSPTQAMQTTRKLSTSHSPYGSDTDISTSNENLSMEQRYVLRHTPRIEPQGQENLLETTSSGNENSGRYSGDQQRFSSNTSSDSTRYSSNNRNHPENQTSMHMAQQSINDSHTSNASNSNRNSLKDNIHSNRSSMDVSTCSYNTLIIHPDDTLHGPMNRLSSDQYSQDMKKDRPHSYGEQGMQEITEIPDDYLNQSHVLKHLAKEMKLPSNRQRTPSTRERSTQDGNGKNPPKYEQWMLITEQNEQNNKIRSKSQPDLTKLPDSEIDAMETLVKENHQLKQQLQTCFAKVAKTQKLEEEVTNIYRAHEELKQTCERREKLERAARMRLQSDLQRVQELNSVMKDQVDILQSQLLAPSEHQILIAQLFTQNKELSAAKERQDIELGAQRATLQEQRNHIGILDSALTNAQQNIRRLEEELRKKQIYIDRLNQIHGALQQNKQCERKLMLDGFDGDLIKDSNRSGSSTTSDTTKWQLGADKAQMMRVESEQRQLDAMRQNAVSKLAGLDKSQQDERILAEAKHDKLRYLEEVHSAQRRVNDLQAHLKILESKLSDKDAEIRLLQDKKNCGSSFDSYNSYGLPPLVYTSQPSYNPSNNSFNATANTASLLEQAFSHPSASMASSYGTPNPNYSSSDQRMAQVPSTFKPNSSTMNMNAAVNATNASAGGGGGNYSANSSSYSNNYESPNYTQNTSSYDTSYENITRKSIDDQMKKHIDEQLLTKRGLCCFPGLSSKKSNMALLSDQVSVLSANNSDSFLQDVKSYTKLTSNPAYQLSGKLNDRGASLPPNARPPRCLKPPRKIEYDRLSDTELKGRSQTPPKLSRSSPFDCKSATLKRNDYPRRDFGTPPKNYVEMKEMLNFPNPHFSMKRKDYGTTNKAEFSKPEHTSTKYYQRLEDSPKPKSSMENGFKRSLLPSARKYSPTHATATSNKQHSRDSLNSSESNHSMNSNLRHSPLHTKVDMTNVSFQHLSSRTPPKYISLAASPQDKAASLPPKPIDKIGRRGNSLSRNESRYKIQF